MSLLPQRGICLAHSQALPHLYKLVTNGDVVRLKRFAISSVNMLTPLHYAGSFVRTYVYDEPNTHEMKVKVLLGETDLLAVMKSDGSICFKAFAAKSTALIEAQLTAIIYTALEERKDYDPSRFAGIVLPSSLSLSGDFDGDC